MKYKPTVLGNGLGTTAAGRSTDTRRKEKADRGREPTTTVSSGAQTAGEGEA